MKKLFLISSSRYQGGEFWAHCVDALGKFLEPAHGRRNKVLFIPYANADGDYTGYTQKVSWTFNEFGYELVGIQTYQHPTVEYPPRGCFEDESICAVCVGGGNTWILNYALQNLNIVKAIKDKVENGEWKYIGASAGTVSACPSILTTNDMAPVLPKSSNGFEIIPFQINPHFVPGSLVDKHMGETREERIRQVIKINPDWQVVGLPEGCWIEKTNEDYILSGIGQAIVFRKNENISIWLPGEPFSEIGML